MPLFGVYKFLGSEYNFDRIKNGDTVEYWFKKIPDIIIRIIRIDNWNDRISITRYLDGIEVVHLYVWSSFNLYVQEFKI